MDEVLSGGGDWRLRRWLEWVELLTPTKKVVDLYTDPDAIQTQIGGEEEKNCADTSLSVTTIARHTIILSDLEYL